MTEFKSVEFIEEFCHGLNAKHENSQKAFQHFQNAIELGPRDFGQPYEAIGHIYMDEGSFEDAIKYLNTAIEIDDHSAIAQHCLGYIYLSEKDYIKAEHYFENAVRVMPLFGLNHYNLGLTYKKLNKLEKARKLGVEVIDERSFVKMIGDK